MFTQEQLGAIKGVVVEAVKPLEDKFDKRFDTLEKKIDENFESHQEQVVKVSVQITTLEKKVDEGFKKMDEGFEKMDEKMDKIDEMADEGFKEVQSDLGPLCKAVKDMKWDQGIIKHKLAIAEENKPALFMRRQ